MSRLFWLSVALRGGFCVYAATLALIAALISFGSAALFKQAVAVGSDFLLVEHAPRPTALKANAKASVAIDVRGHVTLTQDWLDRIRSDDFWSGRGGARGGGGPSQPYTSRNNLFGSSRPEPPARVRHDDVPINPKRIEMPYRTVCVRQCDGYFFPVSFATTEAHFQRDRAVCEKSCGQSAKLYVSKNRNGDLDDLRDLDGLPYSKLPTAYQFRTKYEPTCKCNPHPWEQEAQDKHRLLAEEQQRRDAKQAANAKSLPNVVRLDATRGKAATAAAKLEIAKLVRAAAAPAPERAVPEASPSARQAGNAPPPKFLIINAALATKPQPPARTSPNAERRAR